MTLVAVEPVQAGILVGEPFDDIVLEPGPGPGPGPEWVGGIPDVIRFVCTPDILSGNPNMADVERSFNEAAAKYLPCIRYRYDPTIPIRLGANDNYDPVNPSVDKYIVIVGGSLCFSGRCVSGVTQPTYINMKNFSVHTLIHETIHMLAYACNRPKYGDIDRPYASMQADTGRFQSYCPGTCQYTDNLVHLAVTPATSGGRQMCTQYNVACQNPVLFYPGAVVPLETIVTNAGRVTVSTYIVRFSLRGPSCWEIFEGSNPSPPCPTFAAVETRVTSPLAPGQSRTMAATLTLPAGTASYNYHPSNRPDLTYSILDMAGQGILCTEAIPQ